MDLRRVAIRVASYNFETKAKINALVIEEIARLTSEDHNAAAVAMAMNEGIHSHIQGLANSINEVVQGVSSSKVASMTQPLSDRPDYGSGGASVPRGEKTGIVKKTPDKKEWCVKSEDNPDWNGGCYPSKSKAEDRLKQVDMFKHMGKLCHQLLSVVDKRCPVPTG